MELLANREVAGRWVVPSEEPVVLEHVAPEPTASEPAVPEPAAPEPAAPEPTCSEHLSYVWTSQQEVSIVGMQVVPWVEESLEEANSKWRNLEW